MIDLKTQVQKTGFAAMTPKQQASAFKDGTESMGDHWISDVLPVRFSVSGQNVFHMQQRKWKYIKRAKKINSSWRPLVLTGKLAQAANTRSKNRVTGTGEQSQAKITIPRGHATQRYISEEMVETTKKQVEEIKRIFLKTVEAMWQASKGTSKKETV